MRKPWMVNREEHEVTVIDPASDMCGMTGGVMAIQEGYKNGEDRYLVYFPVGLHKGFTRLLLISQVKEAKKCQCLIE